MERGGEWRGNNQNENETMTKNVYKRKEEKQKRIVEKEQRRKHNAEKRRRMKKITKVMTKESDNK